MMRARPVLLLAASLTLASAACDSREQAPGRREVIRDMREACVKEGGEFRVDPVNTAPSCAYPGDTTDD